MQSLYSFSEDEIESLAIEMGESKYRSRQLWEWLYKRYVRSFDEMTNISKMFREKLSNSYSLNLPEVVDSRISNTDNSVKFLFSSPAGVFEAVILFSEKRRTLCISSQIGCALACSFCETGKLGFIKNLTVDQVVGQLIVANRYLSENDLGAISNIVFMGMGEALSNYDVFKKSLQIIKSERGLAIGSRKITVSTAGVVSNIDKLINDNILVQLAISLNASSDEERSELMPINKRYPISELLDAADRYAQFRGRPTTLEYVLISQKNDSDEAASRLVSLLKKRSCKVNLIPLNDCTSEDLTRPFADRIDRFSYLLHKGGISVTVRHSGGQDIGGACGQLSGQYLRDKDA